MYVVIELGLSGFVVYIYEGWGCIKHVLSHIFQHQCREVLVHAFIEIPPLSLIFFIVIVVKSSELYAQISTEFLWEVYVENKSNSLNDM